MAARLVVSLLLAASSSAADDTFSFVDFFEGEWDMEKTLPDATVVHAEYHMTRDPRGLSGHYLEGGASMLNITVVANVVNPSKGTFKRNGADTSATASSAGATAAEPAEPATVEPAAAELDIKDAKTIFTYDFSELPPANGVRVSMDAYAKTTFMVTSPTTFLLTKVSDTNEKTSWSGKRRQPAPVVKPKSLLRRYGLQLILLIIGLVAKQAYDAALAKADAPAGKAPATAAPKKSKKA